MQLDGNVHWVRNLRIAETVTASVLHIKDRRARKAMAAGSFTVTHWKLWSMPIKTIVRTLTSHFQESGYTAVTWKNQIARVTKKGYTPKHVTL